MIRIVEPFAKRHFDFVELIDSAPWKIKLYTIRYGGDPVPAALIDATKRIALERLRSAAEPPDCHHFGFLGVHTGRTANFVFLDFWAAENELHHTVWISSLDTPERLETTDESKPSVCVYDLHLQYFERQAWIRHVLSRPEAPDFAGYLSDRFVGDA